MSAFINAIRAELTGNRKAKPHPLLTVRVESKEAALLSLEYLSEYRIEVAWRLLVTCEPEAAGVMMDNVVRQLRDAIYGEFRDHAILCERAIYEYDMTAARKEISAMMRLIYGEG